MLNRKVNIKQLNSYYNEIKVSKVTVIDYLGEDLYTLKIESKNHHLKTNDEIVFMRQDRSDVVYKTSFRISVIDRDNFIINYNFRYNIFVGKVENIETKIHPLQTKAEKYLKLTLLNNHIFTRNWGDIRISEEYDITYKFGTPSGIICKDKRYFRYNNDFVYWSTLKDEENRNILLPNNIINIKNKSLYYENEILFNKTCIIPFINSTMDVIEDITSLLIEVNNNNIGNDLNNKTLYIPDERYVIIDTLNRLEENEELKFQQNVTLLEYKHTVNNFIALGQNNGFDLNSSEYIRDRLNQNLKINQIIDYERKLFSPVYTNKTFSFNDLNIFNETLKDVYKIKFNIHLRERDIDNWDKNVEKYWNSFTLVSDKVYRLRALHNNRGLNCGDPLGLIGYTVDDIYNMSERLKKTFIRISIYDTPNRNTQKLLYYSTVFLDSNKLHSNLLRQVIINKDNLYNNNVIEEYHPDDKLNLSCEFEINDMFNNKNSSEGFYLYLFPNTVEYNEITELYMKVEFNHAKYGKTIPLVMPCKLDDNGMIKRFSYTDENFPITYLKKGNFGAISMDMNKLYNDMYIKIGVKYDYNKKRYVWFIKSNEEWAGQNGVINVSLFEPKTDINDNDIVNYKNNTYINSEYYLDVTFYAPKYGLYKIYNGNGKYISMIEYENDTISNENKIYLKSGENLLRFYLIDGRVPNGLFNGLNVKKVVFGENITEIGIDSFANTTYLYNINLRNVKVIGERAFANSSLTEIQILSNVELINMSAFLHNKELKRLFIKNDKNDITIKKKAFSKCYKLDDIIFINDGEEKAKKVNLEDFSFMECRKILRKSYLINKKFVYNKYGNNIKQMDIDYICYSWFKFKGKKHLIDRKDRK